MTLLSLTFPDLPDEMVRPPSGAIRIGSENHKRLFCHTLLSTFDPYRPAIIDWPVLAPEALARLTSLPIWDIAVQTEGRAALRVQSYGDTIADPLLNQAIALNAFEERRHKHVLHRMVQAYGIKLAPEPEYARPRDPEWAFMVTGYSECIDSFFAFGLFELARRSGFFPKELVDTFEPVMREEGRHILFFVNWVAWRRRNLPLWRRPFFVLKTAAVWLFLIWERIGIARNVGEGSQDNNFTLSGATELGLDVSLAELIEICLAQNDLRLAAYDIRLLRPKFVPWVARFAYGFMRRNERSNGRCPDRLAAR
ncbi:MAG TPA: ferritin-like domain-containing protein [Rhizomicrobium sp.]|nr:ferritin-like domain-containing protein [Rhizomicrobium sp.]